MRADMLAPKGRNPVPRGRFVADTSVACEVPNVPPSMFSMALHIPYQLFMDLLLVSTIINLLFFDGPQYTCRSSSGGATTLSCSTGPTRRRGSARRKRRR